LKIADGTIAMNVSKYLPRAAMKFGNRIAAYDGDRSTTFRQLEDRSNQLANALSGIGVQFQDKVAILLPNCIEWIEAEFGIGKIGAVTVPLSPRLHEAEIARVLKFSEATCVVISAEILERVAPALAALPLTFLVVGEGGGQPSYHDYEAVLTSASSAPVCVDVNAAEHGRVLRLTSGSTGQAKGVFLSHRNWASIAHSMLLDRCSLQDTDHIFNCGGFSHAGGLWLLPSIIRGSTLEINDKFDAEMIVQHIERARATVVQLAPTVLRRILDLPDVRSRDFSKLRVLTYSGAPIDSRTLADALEILGPKLVQSYGSNEAAAVTVMTPHDHARFVGYQGWQQPLGREATLTDVMIMGEDGKPVATGEVGDLAIRGPMVFHSYWREPELTERAFRNGWYITGDLVFRDDTGMMYMAGRSKDIIITGGFNVVPREVEKILEAHPAVLEAAVVGLPHREWGEEVTAFVTLKRDQRLSSEALIDFCRDKITSYKKPKLVHILDQLPLNSNGKVDRPLLRKIYGVAAASEKGGA
jgi:acyl-CoA synthetase (AMP-forming)/AMP-acid ligase II